MEENEDTVGMDGFNSATSVFPSEGGNTRQNKKNMRSILKLPANPMPDREALKVSSRQDLKQIFSRNLEYL